MGVALLFDRRLAVRLSTAASFSAAALHASVTPQHFREWFGYGFFFIAVTIAQALFALLIARRPGRLLAGAGVAMNVGILGLYAVSRTAGVPLGPHAGEIEPVGVIDTACAAVEVVLIADLLVLLCRGRADWSIGAGVAPLAKSKRSRPAAAAATLFAVLLSSAALSAPAAHSEDEEVSHHEEIAVPFATGDPQPAQEPHAMAVMPEPGDPVDPPSPEATPPPPEAPEIVFVPAAHVSDPKKTLVAYTHAGELWVTDEAADLSTQLTSSEERWEWRPKFYDADRIHFTEEGGLFQVDRTTRERRLLARSKEGIAAFDWSPDRGELAIMTWRAVFIYRRSDGGVRLVKRFEDGGGRCGSEWDDQTLEWSPDGSMLLVVSTALDFSGKTMFVIRPDGSDVVAPRAGTHALWNADGSRIYYGEWESMEWRRLDVSSGEVRSIAVRNRGVAPVLSPDGKMLAYYGVQMSEDMKDTSVRLYVFDLETGHERAYATGYAGPLWLSNETLAASDVSKCDDCMHGWMDSGSTALISLDGDVRSALSMGSTMDADTVYPTPAPESPTPQLTPRPQASALPSPQPDPSPEVSSSPTAEPTSPTEPNASPTPSPETPPPTPEGSPAPTPSPSPEPAPPPSSEPPPTP